MAAAAAYGHQQKKKRKKEKKVLHRNFQFLPDAVIQSPPPHTPDPCYIGQAFAGAPPVLLRPVGTYGGWPAGRQKDRRAGRGWAVPSRANIQFAHGIRNPTAHF